MKKLLCVFLLRCEDRILIAVADKLKIRPVMSRVSLTTIVDGWLCALVCIYSSSALNVMTVHAEVTKNRLQSSQEDRRIQLLTVQKMDPNDAFTPSNQRPSTRLWPAGVSTDGHAPTPRIKSQ